MIGKKAFCYCDRLDSTKKKITKRKDHQSFSNYMVITELQDHLVTVG